MPTTYEYFERACRRAHEPLRGRAGEQITGDDGNCAVFWIEARDGRITGAQYKCTTCSTLIALCEHLSELVIGLEPAAVLDMTEEQIIALHAGIPEAKLRTVALALGALKSAVQGANG